VPIRDRLLADVPWRFAIGGKKSAVESCQAMETGLVSDGTNPPILKAGRRQLMRRRSSIAQRNKAAFDNRLAGQEPDFAVFMSVEHLVARPALPARGSPRRRTASNRRKFQTARQFGLRPAARVRAVEGRDIAHGIIPLIFNEDPSCQQAGVVIQAQSR
jgi:hypothetical protein